MAGQNIPYVESGSGDLLGAVGAAPVDSNDYTLNASVVSSVTKRGSDPPFT